MTLEHAFDSFHVVKLGCKVNRVESDDFAALALERGLSEAQLSQAGLVVVNTCTVTGEAEKKTRKAVRGVLRSNPKGRVIVTGCAAAIDPETYTSMDQQRVSVVPKGQMMTFLEDLLKEAEKPANHAGDLRLRVGDSFPTRVGIKVQDGCNNACTYCIVHVARGRAWSRPAEEILREAKALSDAGVKEIVLTGINLGTYDHQGMTLADLCKRLLAVTAPDVRFRISSVEPRDIDEDLIQLLAASDGRICRHLHLPLQAGSTKVLKEMARPYKAEFFLDLVARLRAAVPELSLSTDIIVGFPGETEEDFQETVAVARACRFSKIHIFRYSKRAGTPAAARFDQVPPEVKAERAKRLEAVEEELRLEDLAARKGTRELALVETDGVATTESYHTVPAPEGAAVGCLVECVL